METIQNNTTRIKIRENWDIGVIDKQLKSYLPNCASWGDLNINPEEYKHIMKKIEGALGEYPTVSRLKHLIRQYPVVMITDLISFVLYEFDNNTFWNAWSRRYNIELCTNNQTEIGKMVLDAFKRFDFEIIEDGGYAYVTPILCQAGIPVVCFDKLFDIFDSTINSSYFNAREIINELIGDRSYLIDISVERYFKQHTEKAIDLITQIREMMRSVVDLSGLENNEITELSGVPQRIISRYALWNAEIKKVGRRNRRNTQFYFSPKIVYEETKGICLFIPEQTLRDDSIYRLRWIISSDELEGNKIIYSQVYNDNVRNYTLESFIPLAPVSSYIVELYDDDDRTNPLTSPWTIGLFGSDNLILAFNESGALMPPTQRYISRKGTTIVFDSYAATNLKSNSINYDNINLPKTWADFQAIRVFPADKDASLLFTAQNEVYNIECKHSFDIELEQAGTLFDEKYNRSEIPVYIRFPNVDIVGDIPNDSQSIFNNWQIVISHRFSNIKHVAMLTELSLSISGEKALINLNDYAQKNFANVYGAYELRIYEGKTIRRNITFYFVPPIGYFTPIKDYKTDMIFENKDAVFCVHKKDISFLEFEAGSGISVLPSVSRSNDWVELTTKNKQAYIHGDIIINDGQRIPFKKTIRKIEWSFWDERKNDVEDVGKTKQFYLEDFKATNWRLSLHFTDTWEQYDSIKLALETADGKQLQSKDIIADNFGNCLITLNMFQDTIEQHPLPQKVMLYVTKGYNEYLPITIALIKSFVRLNNPQYGKIQGNPCIIWDKNNSNNLKNKKLELTSLNNPNMEAISKSLEIVQRFKSKDGRSFEVVFLDEPLSDGVYFIDAKEDAELSFFDEDEQAIPAYDSNHILCVHGKQYLENHYANSANDVAAWLSATVTAQNQIEWVSELTEKLKGCIESQEMFFDVKKCSELLFALLINIGNKSNLSSEKKELVKGICGIVNDHVITNTQRTDLLKILMDSNVSNEDCKEIINELQLYLFCPNVSIVFDKASLHRMWDINEKLAILINLRNCATNPSNDIDRVIGKIGSETLEKIITFNREVSCEGRDWVECFERIIGNKCNCSCVVFETSKRLFGDGNEYSKLFVSDKRGNWSREKPTEQHTDGYEIFGKSYLKLIYDLIPEIQDEESKQYTELAKKASYMVEALSAKYTHLIHNLQPVLKNRLGDSSGNHKLFYQIGCASALTALSTNKVINPDDLKELLPFWKYTNFVYSDLVYRDLIIAELYALQSRGKIYRVYESY